MNRHWCQPGFKQLYSVCSPLSTSWSINRRGKNGFFLELQWPLTHFMAKGHVTLSTSVFLCRNRQQDAKTSARKRWLTKAHERSVTYDCKTSSSFMRLQTYRGVPSSLDPQTVMQNSFLSDLHIRRLALTARSKLSASASPSDDNCESLYKLPAGRISIRL